MRISLYMHKIFHSDASELCNSSHIVSGQIYQHNMLCLFFRIIEQTGFKAFIFFFVSSSRSGSRDGAGGDNAVFVSDNHFGRASYYFKISKIKIIQIRGWIHFPKFLVESKSILPGLNSPAL